MLSPAPFSHWHLGCGYLVVAPNKVTQFAGTSPIPVVGLNAQLTNIPHGRWGLPINSGSVLIPHKLLLHWNITTQRVLMGWTASQLTLQVEHALSLSHSHTHTHTHTHTHSLSLSHFVWICFVGILSAGICSVRIHLAGRILFWHFTF